MNARRRNFYIGASVITASLIFLWMFRIFGEKSVTIFSPPQTTVEIDAPRVDGLSVGSALTYQGVSVGRVLSLNRNADGTGVTITALISTAPPVPINVNASIVTQNLIGGQASLVLELRRDSKTGVEQPPELLAKDAPYPPIHAEWVGLQLNLLPNSYAATAEEITRAAKAIADQSETASQLGLVKHIDDAAQNFAIQVNHAGEILADLQSILGDHSIQRDLRKTIVNVSKASDDLAVFSAALPALADKTSKFIDTTTASVNDVQGKADDLSLKLSDGLTRLARVLDDMHTVVAKINAGQGLAGQVVNDPHLYQNLLQSSELLNKDLMDLDRDLQQYEQEGLALKR